MRVIREHPALALLVALALIWTAEIWFAQDAVLHPTFKIPEALHKRRLLRLGMDLGLLLFAVFFLPRKALYVLFGLQCATFLLGGVYHDYYGRLPKMSMLTAQSSESMAIWPLILGMLQPVRTGVFGILLGLKAALLFASKRRGAAPAPQIVKWLASGGAVLYVAMFVTAYAALDPLTNMKRWGTASRYGLTYGFILPLATEAYYASNSSFKERALSSAQASTDKLRPLESNIPIHDRIVFLQVESLDWGVVDHEVNGVPVTPHLNALKERSMFFKVEAAHFTGSADADFVAMMGVWPSRDIVTYKIDDYPFDSGLPHELNRLGFETTSIHGVTGAFFNRRWGFEKMGISNAIFQEELQEQGVLARHPKHNWIQDEELFTYAADSIARAQGKTFHFVITVTSHAPFQELPPDDLQKCPISNKPTDYYLCSMSYVDRNIGRYLERLPQDTTLIVYGDHNSNLKTPEYDSGRVGDRDWVPFFIYNHSGNLAPLQRTRDLPVAQDGSLTMVDAVRYVHQQIKRTHN